MQPMDQIYCVRLAFHTHDEVDALLGGSVGQKSSLRNQRGGKTWDNCQHSDQLKKTRH